MKYLAGAAYGLAIGAHMYGMFDAFMTAACVALGVVASFLALEHILRTISVDPARLEQLRKESAEMQRQSILKERAHG